MVLLPPDLEEYFEAFRCSVFHEFRGQFDRQFCLLKGSVLDSGVVGLQECEHHQQPGHQKRQKKNPSPGPFSPVKSVTSTDWDLEQGDWPVKSVSPVKSVKSVSPVKSASPVCPVKSLSPVCPSSCSSFTPSRPHTTREFSQDEPAPRLRAAAANPTCHQPPSAQGAGVVTQGAGVDGSTCCEQASPASFYVDETQDDTLECSPLISEDPMEQSAKSTASRQDDFKVRSLSSALNEVAPSPPTWAFTLLPPADLPEFPEDCLKNAARAATQSLGVGSFNRMPSPAQSFGVASFNRMPTRFSPSPPRIVTPRPDASPKRHCARSKKGRLGVFRQQLSPLAKRKVHDLESPQPTLRRLTRSRVYELVNAAVICLNALFLIWETERRASLVAADPTDPSVVRGELGINIVADVFCLVFAIDLALRGMAERAQFFVSREWRWNVFDIVVVVTASLEMISHWHQYAVSTTPRVSSFSTFLGKFSMLRIVRLLRIIRGSRAIRLSRFVRELRVMVYSLTGAMKSLAWSIVLMLVVLLIFGVFFTDGVVVYRLQHVEESPAAGALIKYFGTLSGATVSLFQAMSGGVDWAEIWEALELMPYEYQYAFLIFIAFATMALLNVITAVFVETAMQRSQNDRELLVQQEMETKTEFVDTIQRVFMELDSNGSGTLTLEEFERQVQDESVLTFLSTLELDIDQVRTLLTLLDVDRNGEVDIDEFITGCLRLKGGAKSLDMAILQYQIEWILHNLANLSTVITDKLDTLTDMGSVSQSPSTVARAPPPIARAAGQFSIPQFPDISV